jgi:glycosidase
MKHRRSALTLVSIVTLVVSVFSAYGRPSVARANTPAPSTVTLVGDLQSELGCAGDWDPTCAATHLTYDATDDVWQGSFTVPAGSWQYKVALNDSWNENYGAHAQAGGANISLNLAAPTTVKFYYDHKSHWITDNQNSVIATVPGSFQSEIGCPSDWQPDCLRSWLEDPDGDGTYTFQTSAIPHGSYEAKVAINESWDVNYGQGGTSGGANIPFTVPADGSLVTFSYVASTHILTITVAPPTHSHDNNVEYAGLGHNSQDTLYRTPGGAVPAGTTVTLRFRTYHNDVTGVRARLFDTAAGAQSFKDMSLVASDVSCYDPSQPAETCDFWQTTVSPPVPTTLYYRFIVRDGTSTAYYADDSWQDGGWGTPTPNEIDNSYPITVYDPTFTPITWMKNAVIYQIFPDRFLNGRHNNDAGGSEIRYGYPPSPLDKIQVKSWGSLPEGYCVNYVNPATPCTEGPRGRDYFGGDLKGVDQQLDYLKSLGVTVLYLNPIFDAASNHGYDTRDYLQINPLFGTQKDWDNLQKHATQLGMHIILDGVFNHVSSDSPYFDRYHHYAAVGACESVNSPYRSWFTFTPKANGPCAGPGGSNTMDYSSWFGFDTLPVLNKNVQAVRDLIYAGPNSVARTWLQRGAAGWRLDVMSDPSFPDQYWQQFRAAVKSVKSDAPIICECWMRGDVLPKVHGDTADTTMNYRFRNAVTGFLGTVDNKGFHDDGASLEPPSRFALKMSSLREDYPDATYQTAMNLVDSHDTERILWSLTPGPSNRESREFNAANLAIGKARQRLASLIQFTVPGAPTIYYGDEVGMTGATDPDDRRTFPWNPDGTPGGDASIRAYYTKLAAIRAANQVLRDGTLKFLLTDDTDNTLAYAMRTGGELAIIAVNRNETPQTLTIPLAGYLPDGVTFTDALNGGTAQSSGGFLTITLPAEGGAIEIANPGQDITGPAAPAGLTANAGSQQVSLTWTGPADAASYDVYHSPVSGGGYVLAGHTSSSSFLDTGLTNARRYYYVVRAVDAAGNEGAASAETSAIPHYTIDWANLQWPPTITKTIDPNPTDAIYGQVYIGGVTSQPGPTPGLVAQVGFGPHTDPGTWTTWTDMTFNTDAGNNDEYTGTLRPEATGTFDYGTRYSTDGGNSWVYADLNGLKSGSGPYAHPGVMTINSSGDTTAPGVPANVRIASFNASDITVAWDPNGESDLYRYQVWRSDTSGGPYTRLADVPAGTNQYADDSVVTGHTYYYVVSAQDTSFNSSGYSSQVSATALQRPVDVTFNVTVPASTDGTGKTVHIAGSALTPQWDPTANPLTRVDATHWTIKITLQEGTPLEYKYVLGDWNFVEKDSSCGEIANRTLAISYGINGTQTVNDTVQNWRNVAPCGN